MSRKLGAQAEAIAAAHLERKGYRIVARNFTVKGGELDLVAVDRRGGQETLCFVEVRARSDASHGTAAETVGPIKQRRLVIAARAFLCTWRAPSPPCRFDVVSVEPAGVRVIENAFDAHD